MEKQEIVFNFDTLSIDDEFILNKKYGGHRNVFSIPKDGSFKGVVGLIIGINSEEKVDVFSFILRRHKDLNNTEEYQGKFTKDDKSLPITKNTKFEEILDLFGEPLYDFDDGVEQTAVFSRSELKAQLTFTWFETNPYLEKELNLIMVESTL